MPEENDGRKIIIAGGDGDTYARGNVQLAQGTETRPCCVCRSWEKDKNKIIKHFHSKKLRLMPDGCFETPIALDFPGRQSMRLNPNDFGWCRKDGMPTGDLATCENFTMVQTAAELASRIK